MSAPKPIENPARDSISKLTVSYASIKDSFRKGEPRPEWSYRAGRRSTARVFYRQQKRPAVFGENGVERNIQERGEAAQKRIATELYDLLLQTKNASDTVTTPPETKGKLSIKRDDVTIDVWETEITESEKFFEKPKRIRKPRVKKDAT